ncbi:TraB/VirB10 family protein [Candidatus Tisiphia endosymbiont of Thecophora atra]|uniref:TraB/VirB10 family protein n=1 Tax=Candidatus Tisiphia endosymbiont of Thecophora atra TaxID=3066258 RepID=UPI00312CB494
MTIFAKLKERLSFLLGKSIQLKVSNEVPVASSFIADSQKQSLDATNNKEIRRKQYNFLLLLLGGSIITVLVLINIMQGKIKHKAVINDNTKPKLEVASEALDPEKMWHNHFEDLLNDNRRKFDERLQLAETNFKEKEQKLQEEIKLELTKMQIQLNFAKNELISSTEELKRMRQIHQEAEQNTKGKDFGSDVNIGVIDLNGEIEFDKPKDAKIYIPETSYVSGYLLGGLAVSTALNTPNEHATPIVIRLTERGNLPKNFNLDITTCRILGSSYGDLSSERVIIRLEKMVCIDPITELVITSNIAGIVHGPDGMNGIKGKVVATSSKHIKNALIGGVISGLSQSSKGLDSMTITSLGAIASQKKGFKDMVTDGILSGTSNAAEKIADYYLRMAENMSPVLTIPSGVKVDVVFMKGFFVGELTTHKKITKERTKKPTNKQYGEQ